MYICPHCKVIMLQQTKDDYYGFNMWWKCPTCGHETAKVWYHADYFWEDDGTEEWIPPNFSNGEFE